MAAADPAPPPRSRIARFGVFELELTSGELRRGGIRIPIQDQPGRLLAYLLEHAGEVVTREELHERLWPSEFVDFDHSLNTAIRKLRAALDDSADNPRFIETLARRGYRFIAPVAWPGVEEQPAAAVAPKRSMPRAAIAIAALIAVAILAGAVIFFRERARAVRTVESIAVLPFVNPDRATQHVNDGLTEILIDSISRVPRLRVMAPTTVFRYRDSDAKRAGKELGVAAVVTGSIRQDGERLSVRVELIDARDGAQLWAGRYGATASELSALPGRISRDLAVALGHDPGDAASRGAIPHHPPAEAYDLYMRGLYAWNQRGKDDLQRALEYFNAAIAHDPNFAAPYSGLANTYGVMVGYGMVPVPEGTSRVIANAQKALDLDPNDAAALVSMATTKFRSVWDFAGAEADYQRALKLNPNYATGHQWYADLLRVTGRWEASRREIDLARELDPYSPPIITMKCLGLYYERRYREAIAFARRMNEVDPKFTFPICTISSFVDLGDIASAAAEMKRGGTRPPLYEDTARIAEAYERGGREAFFRTWANELERRDSEPSMVALVYARMGDRDRAFEWLNKAAERHTSLVTNVNVEPGFDVLHSDPRWDELLGRIGLAKVQPPAS